MPEPVGANIGIGTRWSEPGLVKPAPVEPTEADSVYLSDSDFSNAVYIHSVQSSMRRSSAQAYAHGGGEVDKFAQRMGDQREEERDRILKRLGESRFNSLMERFEAERITYFPEGAEANEIRLDKFAHLGQPEQVRWIHRELRINLAADGYAGREGEFRKAWISVTDGERNNIFAAMARERVTKREEASTIHAHDFESWVEAYSFLRKAGSIEAVEAMPSEEFGYKQAIVDEKASGKTRAADFAKRNKDLVVERIKLIAAVNAQEDSQPAQ